MRIPKPKGLARLINPELAEGPVQYDHSYPWNLQPFDFDPPDVDLRPGRHRPSMVDRILSHHEEDGDLVYSPRGDEARDPLSTVDGWYEALQLPEKARMRRNPRFRKMLEEFTTPSKYSDDQRKEMLYSLKFALACDPKRAGYENGVLPFDLPGFDPSEMEPYRTVPRGGRAA